MKRKLIVFIFLSLIIAFSIISWKYKNYRNKLTDQPPYFDLFLAETFFNDTNQIFRNEIDSLKKRPIEWLINEHEFEILDSVYLGFRNISDEKMYYLTWGSPNSRMRINFVTYKNGKTDSIPFDGFGCGTGVFITPLKNENIAESKILNPLMFNPYTGYPLPLKNKMFPNLFKKLFGDSVSLQFEQVTYSLPWNKYPSQIIASEKIVISAQNVIKNWRNRNFRLNPEFEKEYESSFFVKEDQMKEMISTSSNNLEASDNIKLYGSNFNIVLNNAGDTTYWSTTDSTFNTPEGFKIGVSWEELDLELQNSVNKMSGWGYYINLDSGWQIGFCEGISCTNKELNKKSMIKWIFKRQ